MSESSTEQSRWTPKDVWLGVPFIVAGALLLVFAAVSIGGAWGFLAWPAVILGPVILLLGVNAVLRSLRALR